MNIGLSGFTDKRPLVYSLFKLLQNMGSVCFITDDRRYLRLIDMHMNCGHFQNVQIVVTDSSPDEIFEEIGQNVDDFDHVLYDMKDFIPDDLDFVYVCKTIRYEEDEEDFIRNLEADLKFIRFGFSGKVKKGFLESLLELFKPKKSYKHAKKSEKEREAEKLMDMYNDDVPTISITGDLWKFCERVEVNRIIPPVPRVGILEILTRDLAEPLGVNKRTLDKLLSRGGV